MPETRTMLVVTDVAGRVVAAAHPGESSSKGTGISLQPLPGHRVHEVEVPADILTLRGHDLHLFFTRVSLDPRTSRLTLPKVKSQRPKH